MHGTMNVKFNFSNFRFICHYFCNTYFIILTKTLKKETVPPTFLSYAVQLNFSLSPTGTVKELGVHSVVEIIK
jgi:hypothetical protein